MAKRAHHRRQDRRFEGSEAERAFPSANLGAGRASGRAGPAVRFRTEHGSVSAARPAAAEKTALTGNRLQPKLEAQRLLDPRQVMVAMADRVILEHELARD